MAKKFWYGKHNYFVGTPEVLGEKNLWFVFNGKLFIKSCITKFTVITCFFVTGMYLTDLTYIDAIHPNTGGLDDARTRKVPSNNEDLN